MMMRSSIRDGSPGRGGGVLGGPGLRTPGSGRGGSMAGGGRPTAAQLLLQKANSQLSGKRIPIKPREEDELASYLNSLTQKTSQQVKSVNYEEYGDISISSGADPMTPQTARTPSPAIGAGSKFLKKKPQPASEAATPSNHLKAAMNVGKPGTRPTLSDDDSDLENYVKAAQPNSSATSKNPTAGPRFGSVTGPKRGGFQMSSALNKAQALTNKITQRSADSFRKTVSTRLDSDTDESAAAGWRGQKGGKLSRPGSSSDNSVGKDGNKFIKKPQSSTDVSAEPGKKAAAGRRSPMGPVSAQKAVPKTTERQGRGSFSALRGSQNVYLTSEEESLAEFIQGLSGSDSSRQNRSRPKQVSAPVQRQSSTSASPSPSPDRRARRQRASPSPNRPKGKKASPFHKQQPRPVFQRVSSQESDSVHSEVADSPHGKLVISDSISVEEPFKLNLMDSDTLGPIGIVMVSPEPATGSETTRKSPKKVSPFKKARTPSPSAHKKSKPKKDKGRKADKKSKSTSRSIFGDFGIQTVEDLLSDKENTESEIPTEPIASHRRGHDYSSSQVLTEVPSRVQRQESYTDDFEASISERIGEDRPRSRNKGRWAEKVSRSSEISELSEEETGKDYTEDFSSETLSVARDSDTEGTSRYSYSQEKTETEDLGKKQSQPTAARREKKLVIEQRSVEIQTAAPSGLQYQWFSQTGVTLEGPSYGLGSVDPTPIAGTVINPDALEAMTAYSPATLALHDMMKQQVELIEQFAQAHQRLYHYLTDTNQPDYRYTTMQDYKAYIRKHRKPKLTMKQALKMVSEEMGK